MSQTTSVGVVGPSYWLYMAAVMGDHLERVVSEKKMLGNIPKGVYNDVLAFFKLILQATSDTIPENPSASINAYAIAADAVRRTAQPTPATHRELKIYLEECSHFVSRMQEPRNLTDEEVETAKALQKFFLRLQQEGEAEAYASNVDFEAPPAGLRFL